MGFPSPASDYVDRRLSPDVICGIGAESRVLETDTGFAVIEPANKKSTGDVLLILCNGHTQFVKFQGGVLITGDEKSLEGAELDGVEVLGRVSFFINRAFDDNCPVI